MKMKMNVCRFLLGFTVILALLILLPSMALAADITINEANFPDANFRACLINEFGTTLSDEEIAETKTFYVSYEQIIDLTGIEYFTAITYLDCSYNDLTELDVSKNTALSKLDCSDNDLTELDVSNNTMLKTLFCSGNNLTSLDVSKNTALTFLDCVRNNLTSLDVSKNIALEYLYCNNNNLTSLDVSNNDALLELYCHENNLTSLDISKNFELDTLACSSNDLVELDGSKNTKLVWLECDANNLTSLKVPNTTAFTHLNCAYNNLSSLDVSKNTALVSLHCNNNNLTSLNIYNNTALESLYCCDNYIADTSALVEWLEVSYHNGQVTPQYNSNPLHTLTVNLNGGSGRTMSGKFPSGKKVYINAGTREYYTFSGWTSPDSFSFDDAGRAKTYFTMPDYDTTITANWTMDADGIPINETSFPDSNFRNYLTEKFGDTLTFAEIEAATVINVTYRSISDLTGIGYFFALETLYCYDNNLEALDTSKNTALTYLDCGNNNLVELDVSKNTVLTYLNCHNNNLVALDVTKNPALEKLHCNDNNLVALDVSKNTALTELYCFRSNLTELDVSKNTALRYLDCDLNKLITLDVSNNTALVSLYCSYNNLVELDVSNNTVLGVFSCDNNNLVALDVSNNTELGTLNCEKNNLVALDVSKNANLYWLYCQNNYMTSLDVSNNTKLTRLYCNNNYILDTSALEAWLAKGGHIGQVTPQSNPSLLHNLTVLNGGIGATMSGKFPADKSVTIYAGRKEGFAFDVWISSNSGAFEDTKSARTNFTMPDSDTTITANWIDAADAVGDANADGDINNRDVVTILIWLINERFTPTDDQLIRGDVNFDDIVNLADARALIKQLAGLDGN